MLSYYLWEATGKTFTEELDEIISKINEWSLIFSFKENEYEWLKKNCSSNVFQLVNSFAFHIEGEKLEQIEYLLCHQKQMVYKRF